MSEAVDGRDPGEFDRRIVALWAAVFTLGIEDYKYGKRTGKDAYKAARWLEADNGSFEWLCSLFDFDPAIVRARVKCSAP